MSGDRTRHPELTFCPFCGEERSEIVPAFSPLIRYQARCNVCGAEGPPGTTPLVAADFWNERAAYPLRECEVDDGK